MIVNNLQLYQRSKSFIWTDKHISKNMLAAHLDLDSDVASRNISTIKKTVEWISSVSKENAKILDIGCGPGLYSTALSEKGFNVTGIDISSRSIKYAEQKATENNLFINYQCKNYIDDIIEGKFDVVICIYCDFGALIPDEQTILLRKVSDVLSNDGIFIFDVFKSGLCNFKEEKKDWQYISESSFWSEKPHLLLEEVKHFPRHQVWGTRNIVIEEGREPREYITWDHYYSERDIEKLLNKNGFQAFTIRNDIVDENEFTSSDVMFIIAKKK